MLSERRIVPEEKNFIMPFLDHNGFLSRYCAFPNGVTTKNFLKVFYPFIRIIFEKVLQSISET